MCSSTTAASARLLNYELLADYYRLSKALRSCTLAISLWFFFSTRIISARRNYADSSSLSFFWSFSFCSRILASLARFSRSVASFRMASYCRSTSSSISLLELVDYRARLSENNLVSKSLTATVPRISSLILCFSAFSQAFFSYWISAGVLRPLGRVNLPDMCSTST